VLGKIAIVLMTAYKLSPEQEQQMVGQAGADLLLYKPLPRLVELTGILQEAIARR
jgi:CheY-like chemotaxis protein